MDCGGSCNDAWGGAIVGTRGERPCQPASTRLGGTSRRACGTAQRLRSDLLPAAGQRPLSDPDLSDAVQQRARHPHRDGGAVCGAGGIWLSSRTCAGDTPPTARFGPASIVRTIATPRTATTPWSGRRELPWSDGKVGTFGNSYCGWTQWELAHTRPPHLVAMLPQGIAANLLDRELSGVLRLGRVLWWTHQYAGPGRTAPRRRYVRPAHDRRGRAAVGVSGIAASGCGTCRWRTFPMR